MKRLIIILILMLSFSCQNNNKISESEKQKIVSLGDSSATLLLKALVSSLKGAIGSGGIVGGIEFCSKNAQTLTLNIEQGLLKGIRVKRTTLKYRNEKNKPDKYDEEALRYYREQWGKSHENIAPYIQYVDEEDSYRYYKPLGVKKICLNCHGSQRQINAEVRMRLKKYYANDLATGYKAGDFRGVVRVSIKKKLVK